MSQSRINQSCMIIQSNNQSINHKVTHVGPPPKPVYLARLNVTDPIIMDLYKKKNLFMLIRIKGNRKLFEDQNGIKTI